MTRTLLLSFFLFSAFSTFAQVGIGTTTPDPSAQLDVVSTDKGLLVPRVANTSDVAGTPAKGLVVYQTTTPEGFYVYDGTTWQKLISASEVPSASYAFVSNANGRQKSSAVTEVFTESKLSGFTLTNGSVLSPVNAGTYLISYQIRFQTAFSLDLGVSVNGVSIPRLAMTYPGDGLITQSPAVIADLPAGSQILFKYGSPFATSYVVLYSTLTITRLK